MRFMLTATLVGTLQVSAALAAPAPRDVVRFTARSRAESEPLALKIMTFLTVRDGHITEDDSLFDTKGQPCHP
jgi:hypothetical protein